ncbi:MAG: FecR family protein [Candidatus Omnitrophica bacterium]|nr:FecR family protein [Candidatus Omnitrophota bacterium]MCM8827388.1 FecR family protein [Candidatus Omnitrophota bacterium]
MKKVGMGVLLVLFWVISGGSYLESAEISYIEGNVQVQPSVDKVWKKAEVGMELNIGDSIRTARRSKADVILDKINKHIIRIEEQTLVVLNSTIPGQINKIDISNGKIFSDVERLLEGMTFEISTPSSTSGVRGTGYSVESTDRGDTISVFKGEVNLTAFDSQGNPISEITIPEGFKTSLERFEEIQGLVELTDEERDMWNSVKDEFNEQLERIEEGKIEESKTEEQSEENLDALNIIEETMSITHDKISEAKEMIEEKILEEAIEGREDYHYYHDDYHYSHEGGYEYPPQH